MKLIISFVLLCILIIFSGCSMQPENINQSGQPVQQVTQTEKKPTVVDSKSNEPAKLISEKKPVNIDELLNNIENDYYRNKYIERLDIAMDDSFIFTDPKVLDSETLYGFFEYIVSSEKLYNYEGWYNKTDRMFHVPIKIIQDTLVKYLNISTSIDFSSIYGFDNGKNEIHRRTFGAFGGNIGIKIVNKEKIDEKTIRLTAAFYADEDHSKISHEKVYTIKVDPTDDKTYKYLSIVKIVQKDGKRLEITQPEK